jgi:hypothetical protein
MYGTLLWIHSNLRWLVLLSGIIAIAYAWTGVATGRPWTARARALIATFVGLMDLQFLVGAVLYIFFSPVTRAAFANMRGAMSNPHLRFFTVEHGPPLLIAVALVHIGSVRSRRAPTDKLRYRRFAIWATVAFGLMFASIPWPWLDIGRPLLR